MFPNVCIHVHTILPIISTFSGALFCVGQYHNALLGEILHGIKYKPEQVQGG